jgi:hypothetical protein
MKKLLGDNNKKAREAAVSVLVGFKGKNIASLKDAEIKQLLAAVLQLLGLADQSGNIK